MNKPNTKKIATMALMIAIEIILTRFLSIQTPIVRISFGFIPIAMIAMIYGPIYAGLGAAIADLIGVMLFPTGVFFPGFTATAFLSGFAYGIFLYNRPKSLVCVCVATMIVTVGLQLGLDTLWVQILTGKGYIALLPTRILRTLIMTPVQIICIRLFANKRLNLRIGGKPIYE